MLLKKAQLFLIFIFSLIVLLAVTTVVAPFCGWPGSYIEWVRWLFYSIPNHPNLYSLAAPNVFIDELQKMELLWLVWCSDLLIIAGSLISVSFFIGRGICNGGKNTNSEKEKISFELNRLMDLSENKIEKMGEIFRTDLETHTIRLATGLTDIRDSLEETIHVLDKQSFENMCGYCATREQIRLDWEEMLRESDDDAANVVEKEILNRSGQAKLEDRRALSVMSRAFHNEEEGEC